MRGETRRIPNAEATAYPWWMVIDPVQNMACSAANVGMNPVGQFFSRAAAQAHLDAKRHRYSDRAVVWCGSGHMSADWRALCEEAPKVAE